MTDATADAKPRILVLSDGAADAATVTLSLAPDFARVRSTTLLGDTALDLDLTDTAVLVLVFRLFDKAARCVEQLRINMQTTLHRARRMIVLCGREDMQRAFELARAGHVDDYVVFWPMNHDSLRLRMSVRIALREIEAVQAASAAPDQLAEQVQQLEGLIGNGLDQGDEAIRMTGAQVSSASEQIDAVFDGLAVRLADKDMDGLVAVKNPAELGHAMDRIRAEKVGPPLQGIRNSLEPLARWASGFRGELQPHLASARSLAANALRQNKAVVLIVDDNEILRNTVRNMLGPNGITVLQAESGIAALNALHQHAVDVILMDLVMPDIDGLQSIARIRANARFAQIPVIVVTGKSDPNTVRECLAAGASDFIVKPFRIAALLAKIERVMGR